MRPTVYVETSVISYLAARPSAQLVTAANQQVTFEFWELHRSRFDLYVSLAVVDECSAGDREVAARRVAMLEGLPVLDVSADVDSLAQALLASTGLPRGAEVDLIHISVAAVNRLDYLVTWNCRHIANPALRGRIEETCRACGHAPPLICTPVELIEVDQP